MQDQSMHDMGLLTKYKIAGSLRKMKLSISFRRVIE